MGLFDEIHDFLLIRSREGVVVGRAQLACPGVEHLDDLSTGINLVTQVIGDGLGEVIQQSVQQLRFLEGHGLDHGVILTLFLHHVGGQGPGSPTNPRTAASFPTLSRSRLSTSPTKGIESAGIQRTRALTCSMERIGSPIWGPLLSMMSKSIPMPGRGVRMSENRITPSGLKA